MNLQYHCIAKGYYWRSTRRTYTRGSGSSETRLGDIYDVEKHLGIAPKVPWVSKRDSRRLNLVLNFSISLGYVP